MSDLEVINELMALDDEGYLSPKEFVALTELIVDVAPNIDGNESE